MVKSNRIRPHRDTTKREPCAWLFEYMVNDVRVGWALQWRHNGRDSVSNHQPHYGLLNLLFRRRSKKTSKLRVTGLCAGNSPETGEFPTQMASNAGSVSIWWGHHEIRGRRCVKNTYCSAPVCELIFECEGEPSHPVELGSRICVL